MSGRAKQGNKLAVDKHDKKDAASKQSDNDDENRILQWDLITHEQINALLDLNVDEVQVHLEEALGLNDYQTCPREAALTDYYFSGFWWAKERNLTCQQVSFVMAVLQLLLDNIREKQMPFVENFTAFAKAVASSRQSPVPEVEDSALLDAEQAKALTDYLKHSLFQNYRLYEFLFTKPREELLLGMERTIEVISSDDVVAPLEEGMPADVYFHFLAPPPMEDQEEEVKKGVEEMEEEPGSTEPLEGEECEGYDMQDVREVLGEMTRGMLGTLQAEFTEKLRVQEETYTSRLERLKNASCK